MKKLLEWAFSAKFEILDVIPVEIWHLVSYDSRAVPLARTTTTSWDKYPLDIQRPPTGSVTWNRPCRICDAPLKITVYSRSYLERIMKVVGVIAGIFGPLFAITLILGLIINPGPGHPLYGVIAIAFLIGFIIGLPSVAILFAMMNFSYRKKGISDAICEPTQVGGKLINKHIIIQSPNP